MAKNTRLQKMVARNADHIFVQISECWGTPDHATKVDNFEKMVSEIAEELAEDEIEEHGIMGANLGAPTQEMIEGIAQSLKLEFQNLCNSSYDPRTEDPESAQHSDYDEVKRVLQNRK